jgi:hypothetical protein
MKYKELPEFEPITVAFYWAWVKQPWIQSSLAIVDTLMHGKIVHYIESSLYRVVEFLRFVINAALSHGKWGLFSEWMVELQLIREFNYF